LNYTTKANICRLHALARLLPSCGLTWAAISGSTASSYKSAPFIANAFINHDHRQD